MPRVRLSPHECCLLSEPAKPRRRAIYIQLAEGLELSDAVGDSARWLESLVASVSPDTTSLTVRITDGAEVRGLNERYRSRPVPTDVLSFPGEPSPEGRHLGDVVIAADVAELQAQKAGHNLETELRLLMLHGVLHCLGYDHEVDEGEMEALEDELRERWVYRSV